MPTPKPLPSVEYLRECFEYDPDTGTLTWRARPRGHFNGERIWRAWNARHSGREAGQTLPSGYHRVAVCNTQYRVNRVITKLMTGEDPPRTVDHHDGDPSNDKWENLRPATQQEQNWNQGLRKNNTSGFRGVYRFEKKWVAAITKERSFINLGLYGTPEEAAAAYGVEARKLHGKFYREMEYAAELEMITPRRSILPVGRSGLRGAYRSEAMGGSRRSREMGTYIILVISGAPRRRWPMKLTAWRNGCLPERCQLALFQRTDGATDSGARDNLRFGRIHGESVCLKVIPESARA